MAGYLPAAAAERAAQYAALGLSGPEALYRDVPESVRLTAPLNLPPPQSELEARRTLEALAEAEPADVEPYIHSCGFFRAKAKDIVFASRMLLEQFHGKVPGTMEELLSLPGVGRKTANLILGDVHHTPGVVVADTHCIRITGLLGLTDGTKDPGKVEKQLRACLPPEESNDFCHRLVLHGRAVCRARKPDCPNCTLRPWCDHFQKNA